MTSLGKRNFVWQRLLDAKPDKIQDCNCLTLHSDASKGDLLLYWKLCIVSLGFKRLSLMSMESPSGPCYQTFAHLSSSQIHSMPGCLRAWDSWTKSF